MEDVQSTAVFQPHRWATGVRSSATALFLVGGIAVSELFLYVGNVRYALFGYVLLLVVCTTAPMYDSDTLELYQGVLLIPVFRLTLVGLPVFVIPALGLVNVDVPADAGVSLFWLGLVYGPFVPLLLVVARYNDAVELQPGWLIAAVTLPPVFVLSGGIASIEHALLRPEALIPTLSTVNLVVLATVLIGGVSLVEELLFRGILQESLQSYIGPWFGIVGASVAYAAMYSVYGMPIVVGYAFGFGLFAGYIYYAMRSFATVVLLHGLTTVFFFGIFPITGPWFVLG